jgi:RecB family endonuclease NucS
VTDLKLFRLDADGQDVELQGSTVALEVELQRRIEAGMEAMLGIHFLASEYPTGPWHRGRIDTLGLDENNTPALIEFKRGGRRGAVPIGVLPSVAGLGTSRVRGAGQGEAGHRGR